MPFSIEEEVFEFDLIVNSSSAGTVEPEFELYLDVKNTLVIYPVKFSIVAISNASEPVPNENQAKPPSGN